MPGDQFYYPARSSRALRLTVAKTAAEQIRDGVRALGRAIRGATPRPSPQRAGVQL